MVEAGVGTREVGRGSNIVVEGGLGAREEGRGSEVDTLGMEMVENRSLGGLDELHQSPKITKKP